MVALRGCIAVFRSHHAGGMLIPFHTRSRFAHPMIGSVETRFNKAETHVSTTAHTFAPKCRCGE